jgi:glycosyltransferase involved in cell wall biosynthesis
MPDILDTYPNLTLVIVGGKYDGLGSEFEVSVNKLINELDLNDNVIMTGYVDDIESTIAALDVLVHAAEKEPLGRVIIESLLVETPVIGTLDGGIPEIIDHEKTGLLVPVNDPTAISEAVVRYLANPEWAAKMACQGRKKAKEKFDADTITAKEEHIYQSIIYS